MVSARSSSGRGGGTTAFARFQAARVSAQPGFTPGGPTTRTEARGVIGPGGQVISPGGVQLTPLQQFQQRRGEIRAEQVGKEPIIPQLSRFAQTELEREVRRTTEGQQLIAPPTIRESTIKQFETQTGIQFQRLPTGELATQKLTPSTLATVRSIQREKEQLEQLKQTSITRLAGSQRFSTVAAAAGIRPFLTPERAARFGGLTIVGGRIERPEAPAPPTVQELRRQELAQFLSKTGREIRSTLTPEGRKVLSSITAPIINVRTFLQEKILKPGQESIERRERELRASRAPGAGFLANLRATTAGLGQVGAIAGLTAGTLALGLVTSPIKSFITGPLETLELAGTARGRRLLGAEAARLPISTTATIGFALLSGKFIELGARGLNIAVRETRIAGIKLAEFREIRKLRTGEIEIRAIRRPTPKGTETIGLGILEQKGKVQRLTEFSKLIKTKFKGLVAAVSTKTGREAVISTTGPITFIAGPESTLFTGRLKSFALEEKARIARDIGLKSVTEAPRVRLIPETKALQKVVGEAKPLSLAELPSALEEILLKNINQGFERSTKSFKTLEEQASEKIKDLTVLKVASEVTVPGKESKFFFTGAISKSLGKIVVPLIERIRQRIIVPFKTAKALEKGIGGALPIKSAPIVPLISDVEALAKGRELRQELALRDIFEKKPRVRFKFEQVIRETGKRSREEIKQFGETLGIRRGKVVLESAGPSGLSVFRERRFKIRSEIKEPLTKDLTEPIKPLGTDIEALRLQKELREQQALSTLFKAQKRLKQDLKIIKRGIITKIQRGARREPTGLELLNIPPTQKLPKVSFEPSILKEAPPEQAPFIIDFEKAAKTTGSTPKQAANIKFRIADITVAIKESQKEAARLAFIKEVQTETLRRIKAIPQRIIPEREISLIPGLRIGAEAQEPRFFPKIALRDISRVTSREEEKTRSREQQREREQLRERTRERQREREQLQERERTREREQLKERIELRRRTRGGPTLGIKIPIPKFFPRGLRRVSEKQKVKKERKGRKFEFTPTVIGLERVLGGQVKAIKSIPTRRFTGLEERRPVISPGLLKVQRFKL